MDDLRESLSLDPDAAAAMEPLAAYDADHYLATTDEDEACDFASQVAPEAEVPMVVLFVPEAGEYRAGPVDEMDVLAHGSEEWEIVEAFDEDGEPSPITDDMFDDDDVELADEDLAQLDDEDRALEERIRRLSAAARRRRARSRRKRKPMNSKRRARMRKAKLWRRRNKNKIKRYNKRYRRVRREDAEQVEYDLAEALVARRTRLTRLQAKRKSLTTMTAKRRDTAQRAKRWRLNNKSKARRYGQLYRKPHTKVEAAALISDVTAAVAEGASIARIVNDLLAAEPLAEARKAADLRREYDRLRRQEGWSSDGWDRARIIREIDPNFIHHLEHFDRLLHGGTYKDGAEYPGGGGLSWGGLVVSDTEALLRVRGSHEWRQGKQQEVYQQTIRFANYHRVVEAAGLSWAEKALVLLTMDPLRVHCDCDAYRFFHQRAATTKGFALVPEGRDAPINNPNNRSGACKHLNVVLKWLGAQSSRMAGEMRQHHERRKG